MLARGIKNIKKTTIFIAVFRLVNNLNNLQLDNKQQFDILPVPIKQSPVR